jgi:hypothetical protein
MIFFNLFSIKLSWSYDSGCKFSMLIRIDSFFFNCLFLISFFNNELVWSWAS